MPNPIFSMFGNQQPNNFMNLINQFNQFKSTFSGNPQEKVQELLRSGQMTQEQFNQFSQMANQLKQFIK